MLLLLIRQLYTYTFFGYRKLNSSVNEERMKKSQILFADICKATKEWNGIFSFPALFIITSKIITASCSLFAFIQGLLIPNYYLTTVRWFMLATSTMDCIMMVIIFTAADMPVNEVYNLSNVFMYICWPRFYEWMQAIKLREQIIEINNNWLSTHSIVSPLCLQVRCNNTHI